MLCADVYCIVFSHVQFIKVQNLLKTTVHQHCDIVFLCQPISLKTE